MDSDNIFEGLKENKKTLIIAFVLILILFAVSIFDLFGGNNEEDIDMKGIMKSFAEIYYEEYYYPQASSSYGNEYSEKLKEYEDEGIVLTLREMVSIFEDIDASKFYRDGNYCDDLGTHAIIYPNYPYGAKDYKIEIQISCDNEIEAD